MEVGCSSKRRVKMTMGSFYHPQATVLRPLGDDAHFLCEEKQTFGVADGVGGWTAKGVNAGDYARELMKNCLFVLDGFPKGKVKPRVVLEDAFSLTKARGSSTACIVTLKDNNLDAANVGDSGFMQFRDNKLIYQSPIQQKPIYQSSKQESFFNCPYQLGKEKNCDLPHVAAKIQLKVEPGDIIVAGTDGLLDNMFPFEIEEILSRAEGVICPEKLASTIAECAVNKFLDSSSDSPYKRNAQKAGRRHFGGKADDVSVIVAKIEPL